MNTTRFGYGAAPRYWLGGSALIVAALALLTVLGASAAPPGNALFQRTWQRTDLPVGGGQVSRTWMWGPEANTGILTEPYAEAPGGEREVQYFDKARMEDNSFRADGPPWDVTNGLLVVELITGNMQTGDASFEQRGPAQVNVAGDADDTGGPQYSTFAGLLDAAAAAPGGALTLRLDRQGAVDDDPGLASYGVTAAAVDEVTKHAIAAPFWEFMNSSGTVSEGDQMIEAPLFENPYFATGRPVTEAYWATVKVAGTERDVLMQCFERRCLTYTPGNPEGFVVEAGNVGQHYFQWRYGQQPGDQPGEEPSTPTATATATKTPTATPTSTATATPTTPAPPTTEYTYAAQWFGRYESIAPLQGPTGVGVTADNHLWVADTYNHRLVEFDENGVQLFVLGSPGGAPGQFSHPTDFAFSEDGRMYVTDQNNDRIQVFGANRVYITHWGKLGSGNGEFKYPSSIAIHDGTLYVTDRDNHRIQMFDLNGVYKGQFGSKGSGDGQFEKPQQVAFDPQGNIYVVDSGNHRIQKFTGSGTFITKFGTRGSSGGQFYNPHGIAIDAEGYIYVADHYNNRIQKLNPDGIFLAIWSPPGSGDGFDNFDLPFGLEIDKDGNVYVADFANERVKKHTSDGDFLFEIRDASRGKFGTLMDIAIDPDGNLLTVDVGKEVYDSGSISRYSPAGIPLDAMSKTRPGLGQYDILAGVAVNPTNGDIYVTDRISNRVQRFTSTWEYIQYWGVTGTGPGELKGPTALAVDPDGYVYVADTENNRVQKFTSNGGFVDQWGGVGDGDGQFQQPSGIAIRGNRVYVSDYGNDRVQIFDREGAYLGQFGVSGAGPGQLDGPVALALNPDGSVLVVDGGNNRVQIFDGQGEHLGGFGSTGTGAGQFNLPIGIAVDANGVVYVADLVNDRIQKFTPAN